MILVTGANGFVGRVLMARLNQRGQLARGTARVAAEGFFPVGDLNEATDWSKALEGVDTVIHLAGCAHGKQKTAADPMAELFRVNRDGTLHLARSAAAAGVKRFVFVSSIKVNGEATHGAPFTGDDARAPEDAYGQSKAEAEIGLEQIARETGMELVIVRPPLVYGPGVKANFKAMVMAVRKKMLLPLGAVANQRSLIYVSNLADFLIRTATHPTAAGQIFTVSDGEDVSTTQLLKRIAMALGSSSRLIPVPVGLLMFVAQMIGKKATAARLLGSLQVDSSKARTLLEWEPPFTMREGLKATVEATSAK